MKVTGSTSDRFFTAWSTREVDAEYFHGFISCDGWAAKTLQLGHDAFANCS